MRIYSNKLLTLGALFIFFFPCATQAQSGWNLDIGAERSDVTIYGSEAVWQSQHFQVGWMREQTGGWFGGIEHQDRFGHDDLVLHTNGYRRLGDWTIGAGMAGAPDADFWFRRSYEGEISRRIVGSLVASGAYRFMQFPGTDVRQPQAALTWYHSRGEIQGRVFLTRNSMRNSYSATGLLQSSYRIAPRVQVTGAIARGDRIFDIQSLAERPATAWVVRGALRINVSRSYALEIGGGFARENPEFEQRTVALSIRRSF